MNKKEQYVAAIDIGTTKIVAIVGKKNENGKIEILGLSKALSKGVKRGVVLNIEETVTAIQTTVEDVQKRSIGAVSRALSKYISLTMRR